MNNHEYTSSCCKEDFSIAYPIDKREKVKAYCHKCGKECRMISILLNAEVKIYYLHNKEKSWSRI
jgi:hypothetical protein